MKKIHIMLTLIGAVIAASISVACTSSSDDVDYSEMMNNAVNDLKGTYAGNYLSAGSVPKRMKFTIDETLNVVVEKFPLDNILSKVYPSDYMSIVIPEELPVYTAPIDSLRMDTSYRYLNMKTPETEQISFTYVKDDVQHTGWAQLYAIGMYSILQKTLTIQFTINDMIIDGQDMQSMTPIHYFVDSAIKDTSDQ